MIDAFGDAMRPYFCIDAKITDNLIVIKLQELVTIVTNKRNEEILFLLGTIRHKEIFDFEKVIQSNLYDNLSLEELAHLTNKSIATFKRTFRKH
jgi:AraC-like DNA-binding protein